VAEVARLMTFVDADDEVPDARQISVSARHDVLDDGRRVLLMDDRGWSESGPPTSGLRHRSKTSWTARARWSDPTSHSVGARTRTWRQTIGRSWLGSSGGTGLLRTPGT